MKKHGLEGKYQAIQDGERIKYLYLKVPNPTKDRIISFITKLPTEFGLEQYIDYDLQWEKTFLEPLNGILKVIGWTSERVSSLDSWF